MDKMKMMRFLIILELTRKKDSILTKAIKQGATLDNLQDWLDGTGRWDRQGVPHERRWWRQKAHKLPSATFRSWFRCRKPTFRKLVQALYGTTYMFRPKDTGPYIDPCERVAVFLFRVWGGHGVRGTAAHFDISEGSVVDWTLKVAKLVVKRLQFRYVRWPSPDEQARMSSEWESEKGLRNVIGGIDGSHIKIPSPGDDLALAYYNYKKFYSLVLLAIVDNRGLFRWFTSNAPGSSGDSGILQATSLFRRAKAEEKKPPAERQTFANGACILGDSAFAEGPWLRTPFLLPSTRVQRYYNFKHSSMRMRVEHAFGRLKWKFLVLQRGVLFNLQDAPHIIDACVVLYNFIFLHEGTWTSHHHIDDAQTRTGTGRAGDAVSGKRKERDDEAAYLAENFLSRDWGAPNSMADRRRQLRERDWRDQDS